jgi:hypothetical protein
MNGVETWHYEALGKAACAALAKNGFDARYAASGGEALDLLLSFVKRGMQVGFGGSTTVGGLGVQQRARELGAVVLDHNEPGLDAERRLEVRRAQLVCDLFVSSTNALTLDGELLNVDGNGNRIAALTFGPRKTVVVAGANKIVRDLDEGFERIRLLAAPMNNKRLDKPNPCVKAGSCQDCKGDSRLCRAYSILKRRPGLSDFTVIVVGESLGF